MKHSGRSGHARTSWRTSSVGAAVHGELPHHPVAVVVVTRVDAVVNAGPAVGVAVRLRRTRTRCRSPAVVEEVLHLAGDLLVRQGGGRRKSRRTWRESAMKRSWSATHSGIDRDAVRVRRNGAIADGKSHDRPSSKRRSETRSARKPGEHRARGAVEPSSRTSSRRCAADDRPGLFRPRTARRRAARVRRALETARARARDRISPRAERRGGRRKTARLGSETARRARPPSRTRDHATTIDRSLVARGDRGVAARRVGAVRRPDRVARRVASRDLGKSRNFKRASSRSGRRARGPGGGRTCCRGAATPSWSWCWRPCRWRPRGPC